MVVARRGSLGVSSATVRNVLARLEEQGFVRQPHTSAGRVPTDRGYRFYVDLLLEHRRPATARALRANPAGGDEEPTEALLETVSRVLSQESHHVGFALAPATEDQRLDKIEFVSLGGSRVLVVAVTEGGQTTQKVVDSGDVLSPEELRRAADYVNRELSGLPLDEVRAVVLARLQEARGVYDGLMAKAFAIADRALEAKAARHALYVDGTASLLADASQSHEGLSLETLRALVEMIEEKQRLVRLLTEYLDAPGLAVVIGAEHALPDLKPFSIIAASYLDGRSGGSVGVIGPTRMRYSRPSAWSRVRPARWAKHSAATEPSERSMSSDVNDDVDIRMATRLTETAPSRRASADPAWRSARRATSFGTSCCGRPSSTTTASAWNASGARRRTRGRRRAARPAADPRRPRAGAGGRRQRGAAEPYRRGVELIHKQLLDLLTQTRREADRGRWRRLRSAPPPGRGIRAVPAGRDGEVIEELRRGYCSATGCSGRRW